MNRDRGRHAFDRVVAAFVADCRARNLSPRTVEFYLEGLTSFRSFAGGEERSLALRDLDLSVTRAWLADLVRSGRRPATVAARARALRTFSAWALAETYVRTDPLTRLRVPVVPRTVLATFSDTQSRELLRAAPPNLGIVLRVLLDTGLRLSELTGLRLDDVGDGQLRVVGKGGHERAVPYGRSLDASLRRYISRERPGLDGEPGDALLTPVAVETFDPVPMELRNVEAAVVADLLSGARRAAEGIAAANVAAIANFATSLVLEGDLSGKALTDAIRSAGFVAGDGAPLPRPDSASFLEATHRQDLGRRLDDR